MSAHKFKLPSGEELILHQSSGGAWFCPVCGSEELRGPPYFAEGGGSFDMCGFCKFEYGFDDEPSASGQAVAGIENNWSRWRAKLLESGKNSEQFKVTLAENLKNIGISI